MLKYLILPLVVVAGISLWPSADQETDSTEKDKGLFESVVTQVQNKFGVAVEDVPLLGCSDSAIPEDKVEAFLEVLPPAPREALELLLDKSAHVWTIQLYSGIKGVGVCLPQADKLVVFPGLATDVVDQLKDLVSK